MHNAVRITLNPIKKGIQLVNFIVGGEKLSAEQIEEFSQRWSPYRTYATAYMFTALRAGMA